MGATLGAHFPHAALWTSARAWHFVMNKSVVLPHVVPSGETLLSLPYAAWKRAVMLRLPVSISVVSLELVEVTEDLAAVWF